MANNQSGRQHLDAFTRGRNIGKLEEGRSVTSVAAEFGIAHSIVSRLWRQFQTTGTAIRGFSSGRPGGRQREKSLDTRHRRLDDRYRLLPWPEDCTVVVCLHDALYDESRFSLSSDSHRILIWREGGSHNHSSNIIERDRYGGRGVLVWGGIMLGSRTDLHIFDACSVNGIRYCNEILLPYVRLFRGAMGQQFLFLDDNAPCHHTVAAKQLLESEDIERMDWPARSPDLNPIEHVWDFLGRRLAAHTLPPVTIRELRLALQDEWAAMPQQLIDTLILSMGRRCETCLAVRGDHFPTKDRMFLAGHPSQGCFGLQSHCAPCYFFNKASFYPSDFSFNFSAGGRNGVSYQALPKDFEHPKCSGRTALCDEVLNDTWVSFPAWSEDFNSVASRKNRYENIIHRCEEERFELDMAISANTYTYQILENLQKSLIEMSVEEKSAFKLDDYLGGTSTVIQRKALHR
ncbi:paired amphipathic helix protein Sin3b [Trichonephila clavipes]|nr:paired amphipathic helix protein Sin3b [Trichonephila clavipes]